MKENKNKMIILILILVIVLLLGVVSYTFLIKPALNGLVVLGQNQGVQYAVLSIMQKASTCQTVPLVFGNQTMDIIDVKCLQPKQ